MLKAERLELAKVVRMQAKVAKADLDKRAARLLADVESQLAAKYPSDHPAWAEITGEAKAHVDKVDQEIAKRCGELGIHESFRPRIEISWHYRGETAWTDRRTELRKVATTEIAARAKAAKAELESRVTAQLTLLIAGGLETDDAKAFLEAIPSAEQLLPDVGLGEVEAISPLSRSVLRLL